MIKKLLCRFYFHKWKYWGTRKYYPDKYRACERCKRTEVFDDFYLMYVKVKTETKDLKKVQPGDHWTPQ